MKTTVLVVGNPSDTSDSKSLKIIARIHNRFPTVSFVPWDPTEELPDGTTGHITIIDTIQGIDSVRIFQSIDEFVLSPATSVHDFDLPVAIKLLMKLKKISGVTIIGIPCNQSTRTVTRDLTVLLGSISL